MSDQDARVTEQANEPVQNDGRIRVTSRIVTALSFTLAALIGAGAALTALSGSDNDPLIGLLGDWPVLVFAALVYMVGMSVYSLSWAALFTRSDDRRLIAMAFLISQPIKYLPGGFAQPVGQVALTAQVTSPRRRAAIAFPVHVMINVVSALTLAAPLAFVADVPGYYRWAVILVPLLWASLNRRWMAKALDLLGRLHRAFRVAADLPAQRQINSAFGFGLAAHAAMFLAFGILGVAGGSDWSVVDLSLAYGVAWTVGYVALPIPAGLGVRELMLALVLSGTLSTIDVVKVSAAHRATTLAVEILLMVLALALTQRFLRRASRNDE